MYDVNDDAKGGFRRIEILTGPGRRRRSSAEEKARNVEETLAPGARVSEVARRWIVPADGGWERAVAAFERTRREVFAPPWICDLSNDAT